MEEYKPGFTYTVEHIGADGVVKSVEEIHNLIPTEGLDYLLNVAFKGGSAFSSWYLGLYDNARTPVAGDTMTTLIADCGENQDYTGSGRQAITFPAVSSGSLSTVADPNVFDFTTAETIRGAFMTTSVTWGGTTGLLVSAVQFSSPKVVAAGESLRVPVAFALISA